MTQRDTAGTLAWYNRNHDNPPFDPDGMCLKICRYARGIGAMFPSALSAQLATPREHRVYDVSKVRRGMVAYFDDPNDSNPFGHIVTVAGRAKGSDLDDLNGIVTWSNSVRRNVLTKARADYYPRFWNDRFVFAATWLNGVELDLPEKKNPTPKPPLQGKGAAIKHALADLEKAIDHHRREGNDRLVNALRRDVRTLRATLKRFGG